MLQANIAALTRFTRDFLHAHRAFPFSEHALIQTLEQEKLFANLECADPNLLLFQKHFLCMHVLYKLQQEFSEQQLHLNINPLAIYLQEMDGPATNTIPTTSSGELRSYYLDLNVLLETTGESVAELQRDFFSRYTTWLNTDDAFAVLQLKNTANWREIQSQYRRLIHQAHPDKGGDRATFERVQAAYETLKTRHQK